MTTEFEDGFEQRQTDADDERDRGTPSPSTPTTSTPWGSTSTNAGSTGYDFPPGSPDDGWSAPLVEPAREDAPTAAVPLVQGTAAPPQDRYAPAAHVPPVAQVPPATQVPPMAGATSRAARARGPRRARLQLRHVNPWTVLKFSCVLSIALFFVWLIVVGVLFGVLDGAGVIEKINSAYTTIQGSNSSPPVTAGVVFGSAAIIGVVNIVLFIALSTVGSVVYNLCADLVGGIEITLSER